MRTVGCRPGIGVRPCWRIVSVTCHGRPGAVPSGSELRPSVAKPPAAAVAGSTIRTATVVAVAVAHRSAIVPTSVLAFRCLYTGARGAVPAEPGLLADDDLAIRPAPQGGAARQQLEQLEADELAPPALQRADVRLGRALAQRGDDPLQVGAGGEQLVGELGPRGAGADEGLGEGDERRVGGIGRRRADAVGRDRRARPPALDHADDRRSAPAQRALVEAADLREALHALRAALGDLDQG